MPKVSVIIPVHNGEKYIGDAIESVLKQTYKDLEIVVVDDGSTDHTREIVETQRHKDTKTHVDIKYIYQMNKGPGAARNKGIKEAKGEYIAFLDADDLWMLEKIEKQIKLLENGSDISLVYTVRIRIGLDAKVQEGKEKKTYEGWIFEKLLMGNFICCSSVLIRRSCFDDMGLFDEDRNNRNEDYEMWLRIAKKYKFGLVKETLVKYRVNPKGYNRSNIKITYDSEKKVFLKALQYYKGDTEKLKKIRFNKLMYRMGHSFFYTNDYNNASLSFLEAFNMRKLDFKSLSWFIISKIKPILNRDKICQYA